MLTLLVSTDKIIIDFTMLQSLITTITKYNYIILIFCNIYTFHNTYGFKVYTHITYETSMYNFPNIHFMF